MRIPIKFGYTTLVGSLGEFPRKFGNCFGLIDEKGVGHPVVNFVHENLEEWMKRTGQTDIDVQCIPKSDNIWMIEDSRIPREWYRDHWCETCTPYRLLPYEQRKAMFARTKVSQYRDENGERRLIFSTTIKPKKESLLVGWTCELSDDIEAFHSVDAEESLKFIGETYLEKGAVYAPYITKTLNTDLYKKIIIE